MTYKCYVIHEYGRELLCEGSLHFCLQNIKDKVSVGWQFTSISIENSVTE